MTAICWNTFLFGTFHMINDIWYSSPAKQAPYITLVTVYVQAHRCAAHCSTGNVFWETTKKNPKTQSKAYLQHPFFYDDQICELIRTTLQTNTPLHLHRQSQTHRHIIQTSIFWMLIICLLLHPAWKRETERERVKVWETQTMGEQFS